jgi:NAD(P)H dehydrogenase (quinone)
MTDAPILVTAARGHTGFPTARRLLERSLPVRAFVHRHDEKADQLASLGAEVVVGDFHDLESLRRAMDGVTRAYFCHAWVARVLEATTNFAIVGREAALETTVNMSQIITREGHRSPATREHWLGEHVLDWAGIGATHIRPTLFAENLLGLAAPTVAAEGKIYLPFAEGRHAPVAAEDIAAVIVGILTDPPRSHVGQRYTITGPEEMSVYDIAAIMGGVVGKPVEYVDIPTEAWLERLAALPEMNPHFLAHLEQVAADVRSGHFGGVTDVVERIGKQSPQSLEAFMREHLAAFTTSVA